MTRWAADVRSAEQCAYGDVGGTATGWARLLGLADVGSLRSASLIAGFAASRPIAAAGRDAASTRAGGGQNTALDHQTFDHLHPVANKVMTGMVGSQDSSTRTRPDFSACARQTLSSAVHMNSDIDKSLASRLCSRLASLDQQRPALRPLQ